MLEPMGNSIIVSVVITSGTTHKNQQIEPGQLFGADTT